MTKEFAPSIFNWLRRRRGMRPGVAVPLALIVALGAVPEVVNAEDVDTVNHATVIAHAETAPVPHDGDAADDPTIWVNPLDAAASTIIGTDKQGGIAVYDLDGAELQYVAAGELNNANLLTDFPLDGESATLVTAGNRSDNSIAIYQIDPRTRLLSDVTARKLTVGVETYGSCTYRDITGRSYYFVNSKKGEVEQLQLFDDGSGLVDAELVRSFDAGSQTEGCVADDEFGRLYIGEEEVGIWEYAADQNGGSDRTFVAEVSEDGPLVDEVEGLTITYGRNGTGYLLASNQGNSTFVAFERTSPHNPVLTFEISDGPDIDGVSDTDGIDVTTAYLGPEFPAGLFVAQDGDNDGEHQNFKLVPWEAIFSEISASLEAD